MGFQDGTQSMFAVYQDSTGTAFSSGLKNQLILGPQDEVWSIAAGGVSLTAAAGVETYWYGYYDVPVFGTDTSAHVFPFTHSKLSLIVPWAVRQYQADSTRIFAWGQSMGGYGVSTWALRQPGLFAGVFMDVPVISSWNQIPEIDFGKATGTASVTYGSKTMSWVSGNTFGKYLPGFHIVVGGQTKAVGSVLDGSDLVLTTAYTAYSGTQSFSVIPAKLGSIATNNTVTLPDGVTGYNADTDTPDWILQNCSRNLPFIAWSSGRQDTTTPNMWLYSTQLANALRTCHYGFAFVWNNGNHSSVGTILQQLEKQYVHQLSLTSSYPAFTNYSLDSNYGDGARTDGDCNSGTPGPSCYVNIGWIWTGVSDTPSSWSATISNTQLSGTTATTDVTPRNTQLFLPAPGQTVSWTTVDGQNGQVTADSWGLATATGLQVGPGGTTITLTLQ
jgi:Prolyl oligopeptidase family